MAILEPIDGRSVTLSERVYASLRDAIVSLELVPGARVTEAGLARRLTVSKTPVREALLRLEQVGLIESSGNGAHVVEPSAHAIREAYELRIALELEAVRLATGRVDVDRSARAKRLALESLSAAQRDDRAAFVGLDRQFHLELAEGARNTRLYRAVVDVLDLTSALRSRDAPGAHASAECAQHHVEIANAVYSGDELRAQEIMRRHLQRVCGLVLEQFTSANETSGDGHPDD